MRRPVPGAWRAAIGLFTLSAIPRSCAQLRRTADPAFESAWDGAADSASLRSSAQSLRTADPALESSSEGASLRSSPQRRRTADPALEGSLDGSADGLQLGLRLCDAKEDPYGTWNGSREVHGSYTLVCNPGYVVEGQVSITVSCTDELQWPADPWCQNFDDCSTLIEKCGPAGLCVDGVESYECLCQNGAVMRKAAHNEVACYLAHDSSHCGGRSCGAHGICVALQKFQSDFEDPDDSNASYRCSCEHGWKDNGTVCVPIDCGELVDPHGKWSGSSLFGGEYTLECEEGSFIWGGSQEATTLTCPDTGKFHSNPICMNPSEIERNKELENFRWWCNVYAAIACVGCAALAAGLTMGLVSLDHRDLAITENADPAECTTQEERAELERAQTAAKKISPILQDHHLLLVTLLLMNAVANEALPIFLDEVMPPVVAVLVSVSFVLLFGEIIPSAIFTGPMQLTIAARFLPCVELLMCSFYCVAKPIASALDQFMPHEDEDLYTRPQIRAVLSLHSKCRDPRGAGDFDQLPWSSSPRTPGRQAMDASFETFRSSPFPTASERMPLTSPETSPSRRRMDPETPLDAIEAELIFKIMMLGEQRVVNSPAFYKLRVCSEEFVVLSSHDRVSAALLAAGQRGKRFVVVLRRSSDLAAWPAAVALDNVLGMTTVAQLLSCGAADFLRDCIPTERPPQVRADDFVADAVSALTEASGSATCFALVVERGDFAGVFDGGVALSTLLLARHRAALYPTLLPEQARAAVAELGTQSGDAASDRPGVESRQRRWQSSRSSNASSEGLTQSYAPTDLSPVIERQRSGESDDSDMARFGNLSPVNSSPPSTPTPSVRLAGDVASRGIAGSPSRLPIAAKGRSASTNDGATPFSPSALAQAPHAPL